MGDPSLPAATRAPLTHHAILALAEPFARSGRTLDLAASDRAARRLVFRSAPVDAGLGPAGHSQFTLDCAANMGYSLTREACQHSGPPAGVATSPVARLLADGPDPGTLLARTDAVAPACQFRHGPGYCIAMTHRLVASASGGHTLLLTSAEAWLHSLAPLRWVLTLQVPARPGQPAELLLTLAAAPGVATPLPTPDAATIHLPDDLLAVLGSAWRRLDRHGDGWRSSLQLRGSGLARSQCAQARLLASVQHLAYTFAAPPQQFHRAQRWARWAVALRRLVPLLVSLGLIAGSVALPKLGIGKDSKLLLALLNVPPLLLILFFSLREMPRIGIPPIPRPLPATAWRPAAYGPSDQPENTPDPCSATR